MAAPCQRGAWRARRQRQPRAATALCLAAFAAIMLGSMASHYSPPPPPPLITTITEGTRDDGFGVRSIPYQAGPEMLERITTTNASATGQRDTNATLGE